MAPEAPLRRSRRRGAGLRRRFRLGANGLDLRGIHSREGCIVVVGSEADAGPEEAGVVQDLSSEALLRGSERGLSRRHFLPQICFRDHHLQPVVKAVHVSWRRHLSKTCARGAKHCG